MSGEPDAPGSPPLPPADLASRTLPIHVQPAGTQLCRIHRTIHEPLFFGPAPGVAPQGRWDAPAAGFRTCYLAEEEHLAFAETFLRSAGTPFVQHRYLVERRLTRVEVQRELRLVSLHGPGLVRLGAPAAVVSGSYSLTRMWSQALFGHPQAPDGIRYRARHDDDSFAVALFDRAADALAVQSSEELLAPTNLPALGEWLDRYGIGLV